MPEKIITWECSTCHRPYPDYERAEACEANHIINNVAKNIGESLYPIFPKKDKPVKKRTLFRKSPRTKGTFD